MENARKTAVKLLCRVERDGAYSNIVLDEHFSNCQLDAQGRKFCTALFYGALERRLTLDRIIRTYSDSPADKLSSTVRNILRTAIYQIMYMNSVPDSAAVNEAVKLASKCGNPAVKGYVNGLLRSFIRADKKLPEFQSCADRFAFEYSCPEPLAQKWIKEYGRDKAGLILASSIGRPPVTIKTNTCRIQPEKLAALLGEEGFSARQNKFFPDCLDFAGSSPAASQAYLKGLFHVQDISSRLCCEVSGVSDGMTVLDLCSAPGGKTLTLASLMDGGGEIYACDLHRNRTRLVAKAAQRMGFTNVKTAVNDAKVFSESLPMADVTLCDAPCSGLGVIRRKPEIKYKDLSDFDRLPRIQYDILSVSCRYVKPGGVLVYSTCTLSEAENDGVADRFLSEHTEFEPCAFDFPGGRADAGRLTILPDRFDSDGFFIAKFVRTR